jgi:hypothetical protein
MTYFENIRKIKFPYPFAKTLQSYLSDTAETINILLSLCFLFS